MKRQLLFSLSIVVITQANDSFQFQHEPQEEVDRHWNQYHEQASNSSKDPKTDKFSRFGILTNSVLAPECLPLDPELRELVINMSSERTRELAQRIQECTQNSKKECPPNVLLIGAPGIGKTTYVQAVAEKAGLPFIKIDSPFVLNKYKDSGPENLQEIFKPILEIKSKIIVAFDELHCLTDGHKNSNNPNQNTSEALWLLMDKCAKNPNIILIGITNDGSNMPEQLKSRFKNNTYLMKSSAEIAQKQQVLKYWLNKFSHNCDDKCQKTVSQSLKNTEARVIEGIVKSANGTASLGKNEWQITQKDLEKAIKETNEIETALETKKETLPARELTNLEKAGWAAGIFGGVAGGINYLDVVAQRHGGWKKIWEEDIAPKINFLLKILAK